VASGLAVKPIGEETGSGKEVKTRVNPEGTYPHTQPCGTGGAEIFPGKEQGVQD